MSTADQYDAGESGVAPGIRKRAYTRSTPVGRAARNMAKISKIGAVTLARMKSWGSGNVDLTEAVRLLEGCLEQGDAAGRCVSRLLRRRWSPPKKVKTWPLAGDLVKISRKHEEKYLAVYGREVIEDLVVSKILKAGVAVKHGRAAPFLVAKSHLEPRKTKMIKKRSSNSPRGAARKKRPSMMDKVREFARRNYAADGFPVDDAASSPHEEGSIYGDEDESDNFARDPRRRGR